MPMFDHFHDSPSELTRYLSSERAAVDYCNEVVDGEGRLLQVDILVSVRGLIEIENDYAYVPDHNELFLGEDPHGS